MLVRKWFRGLPVMVVLAGCGSPNDPSPGHELDSRFSSGESDALEVQAAADPCSAANPNDTEPDDAALQACLNRGGTVVLRPGGHGYILARGVSITKSGTVLTSSAPPTQVRLVASAALDAPLLRAVDVDDVMVRYIEFDGNRPARTHRADCHGYRLFGTNVQFHQASNWKFLNNRSTRALCGSAFEVLGDHFEIGGNVFDDNGHGTEDADAPEPWADGITLIRADEGYVHDNHVSDATDIGIVDGGGRNARIENNIVTNVHRHAFAGIALHVFHPPAGGGDHTGTVVSGNKISSPAHRISLGLSLGMHPWDPSGTAVGGTVRDNAVGGAVINIAVDGVKDMSVTGNTFQLAGGTARCGTETGETASGFGIAV